MRDERRNEEPHHHRWRFLQLVDGAFPSGGFAHSSGLEAALHLRGVGDVEHFADELVTNVGRSVLPFVRAACAAPENIASFDALFDATCLGHVTNRASRAQGRAFATAVSHAFDDARLRPILAHARNGPAHHGPIFGAVFGALDIGATEAEVAYVHGALRSVLSAAVRLGAIGPLEAQGIQARRADALDRALATSAALDISRAAQTAPLLELFGAMHDALDGRLFQS